MADIALILAEQCLRNRDSDALTTVNANTRERKGAPRSQFTEGISRGLLIQITSSMSDQLQIVAIPLRTALLEGGISP